MRGTYALLVQVPHDIRVTVGKLGTLEFAAGWYAYVGSALGGLEGRVKRHAREEKRKHWHVDYLLTKGQIGDVIYGEGEERKECEIAKKLAEQFRSVRGFGSSDCGCHSHLFYSPDPRELRKGIIAGFRSAGLEPRKGGKLG
jgi:Uri superfamily endonuclease